MEPAKPGRPPTHRASLPRREDAGAHLGPAASGAPPLRDRSGHHSATGSGSVVHHDGNPVPLLVRILGEEIGVPAVEAVNDPIGWHMGDHDPAAVIRTAEQDNTHGGGRGGGARLTSRTAPAARTGRGAGTARWCGGDADERIFINQAAQWFNFAGPGVIRKYLGANPGYFPEPVGTVACPTGRQIPAFRRSDLQDFDRKRTGAAGRPAGPQHRDRKPETEQRINTALDYLREIGGYCRGVAAELADRHNEPAWKWERAVKEARNQRSSTDAAEHEE
ncbi:hypothetical protein [Actinacidiphila oryziradicis]|uniref:Uncharacterized protein n=1 Tax=Actinacidiphila oryziradicis TaxID=2571141 RepID=A0A4U0RI43_9ACTN|nr:hypothetical protein [Actinacidiphila oryziradicis]TJZ94867.1 hypothetical protein FCI23_52825 [Actinacidiphila oryziradicis]